MKCNEVNFKKGNFCKYYLTFEFERWLKYLNCKHFHFFCEKISNKSK